MGHFFTTRMEWPIPFILAEMKLSIFIPARIKWSIRVLERNPERHCSEVMQPGRAQAGKTPILSYLSRKEERIHFFYLHFWVLQMFLRVWITLESRVLEDPKVPYYS